VGRCSRFGKIQGRKRTGRTCQKRGLASRKISPAQQQEKSQTEKEEGGQNLGQGRTKTKNKPKPPGREAIPMLDARGLTNELGHIGERGSCR